MSDFSDVDASASSDGLIAYLDSTDRWLGAIKSYMVAAVRLAVSGNGLVVDVGCGVGHDVRRLAEAGLTAVGVDSSSTMLGRAAARHGHGLALVQADAARLPFADASVDGCRAERVLQHVSDPAGSIREMVRVVKRGGIILAYEPDETTFRVDTDHADLADVPARLMRSRHPEIGGQLVGLLEAAGCRVDDVVTESSRSYGLDRMPVNVAAVIERAIQDGRFGRADADRWLADQRARTAAGTFRGRYDKVLVVACRVR